VDVLEDIPIRQQLHGNIGDDGGARTLDFDGMLINSWR
jgi:hypothetical protein